MPDQEGFPAATGIEPFISDSSGGRIKALMSPSHPSVVSPDNCLDLPLYTLYFLYYPPVVTPDKAISFQHPEVKSVSASPASTEP